MHDLVQKIIILFLNYNVKEVYRSTSTVYRFLYHTHKYKYKHHDVYRSNIVVIVICNTSNSY